MREIRLSGSVEGVVSNHDPYSDCQMRVCWVARPTVFRVPVFVLRIAQVYPGSSTFRYRPL